MFDVSRYWYGERRHIISFILSPLAWLFGLGVTLRHCLYRIGLIKAHQFPVPIIVVGNITVGGTGKTPFVLWLAHFLKEQGYRPGIVSRGVGGKKQKNPYWVTDHDDPYLVGDEALMLAKNTGCPIVIGVNRVLAVRTLLQHSSCDIVISDDGLQHYRLGRSIEIAMVDGERGLGNECLLPAGPLREKKARLEKVDFVIVNQGNIHDPYIMNLTPLKLVSLKSTRSVKLPDFPYKKVHAIAGIGNPTQFFNFLNKMGFDIIAHSFPDHHHYKAHEINFGDQLPIIMTEKDAVKCLSFADERFWYMKVTATVNHHFEKDLLAKLSMREKVL